MSISTAPVTVNRKDVLSLNGASSIRKSTRAVRKAVFPVAGLGTRFLPATKAVAKEMLPIVDRPLIQYAVDEAAAAGIEEIIFITHRSKRAIEDHLHRAVELENELATQGKHASLKMLRQLTPSGIHFSFVRQEEPRGLGHAIYCARHLIGNEPFAVLLPDDLIDGEPPVLAQMISQYEQTPGSLLAVRQVSREETRRYGIVDALKEDSENRVTKIRGVVEKPSPEAAPSTMAIVGRYILSPAIFECIENLDPGTGGEIQLTDGIARLLKLESVMAYRYEGKHYDCGSKAGFLEATVAYGLQHPEVGKEFREILVRVGRGLAEESRYAPGREDDKADVEAVMLKKSALAG
ncbi:UTP--glucose-1-phosphate uridylyltransferase GalU [Nitrosospira briensis]|uniref:UTP--glucose-1-phosphate uridylyltransferase GalU n=1 Tax=Nitrosospira briensis TaxID=35799 RepID=UPI0008E97AF7|nr:UTP--glucose-1-phosphate uridylyltransferase GalU [Nitrosospira briensis]SFO05022.1 UDP-glucose pyrophosphorylase [Nitrosospira briensis]